MKRIPLTKAPLGVIAGREAGDLVYSDVLRAIVEARSDGMALPELRKAVAVLKALDAATSRGSDHAFLEDEHHRYLVERVTEHRFPFAAPALVEMLDGIMGAEAVDPNATATSAAPSGA